MKWRLIEEESFSAAMNMAIDQAIYESVAGETCSPTIRFYKWNSPSVSLGAYQNLKDLNLEICKKHNVEVVRRMTGGRAVFHDRSDFTYSFIAPIRLFKYSIKNAYSEVCYSLINTLSDLGIKSSLKNKNDLVVDGKKISGNAAKAMDKGIYLQHGTLIYDKDMAIMPKVLNLAHHRVIDKVTSILEIKEVTQKKVYQKLKENFTSNKDYKIEKLSISELKRADELAKTVYKSISAPKGSIVKNKGACYVEGI
jgi:lipoate-protein ligase A